MNILITGTSRGIGKDLAEYYVIRGNRVFGCGRSDCIDKNGINYDYTSLDVTVSKSVRTWVDDIIKEYNQIDVLIANAGKVFASSLMMVTPDDGVFRTIDTNLMGTYYVCKEVARQMTRKKFGRIVTISSMTVPLHAIGTSAYSAAKAGIEELTKIMAKEFAPYNITANCIAPSIYDGGKSSAYRLDQELHDKILKTLVIQRPITLTEMTSAIDLFIDNGALTGQVLRFGTV